MMRSVRDAFEAARLDADLIDGAVLVVEAALRGAPDDPAMLAYLGALKAMKAGRAILPWDKMRHARMAMTLLDQAYERRLEAGDHESDWPFDLDILLLRGVAYANFPPFLGQAESARLCLETALVHTHFALLPARHRALVHAHLAVLFRREREEVLARAHLASAHQADTLTADPIWAAQ